MQIEFIPGATRIVGEDQVEFDGLPVLDTVISWQVEGHQGPMLAPAMISQWRPTAEELARLNAGAPVLLAVLNMRQHPPVTISVAALEGEKK